MGWVGLGQSVDGLGWIGSHEMDPWTTLTYTAPQVAEDVAEGPVAEQFVGEWQRHDEETDEDVADCQGSDEPVLSSRERAFEGDSGDDEHVSENNNQHNGRDDDGRDRDVRHGVATWIARPRTGRRPDDSACVCVSGWRQVSTGLPSTSSFVSFKRKFCTNRLNCGHFV